MEINTLKSAVSVIAIVLSILAYIPYYRDIIRGKTHPHIYSWSLWCLLTILIFALSLKGGAGSAAYVTATVGLLCIGVIFLGLKHGKRDITWSDKAVSVLALLAIVFWLIVDQPVVSIILAVLADLLAFIPTVRKSWNKPYTETLSMYVTNTLRFGLVLFAVKEYTILSALWPITWIIGNGLFSAMLFMRRKSSTP